MQTIRRLSVLVLMVGTLAMYAGCKRAEEQPGSAADGGAQAAKPAAEEKAQPTPPTRPATRASLTGENNPTARAGRGAPDLNEFYRPAAWIYVDGQEGKFLEEGGQLRVQWVIEAPVSASPTFRVEAFEPLLGAPKDFACTLDTDGNGGSSSTAYAIKAVEGMFEVGREYSLLRPGDTFVVRNRVTGDVVQEIPPLPPGDYMIAAGVKNLQTGKEGLAITSFTVAESTPDTGE